jgi:hypothetical protein
VNCGIAEPETDTLNVLSLILPRLSVALTTNVEVVIDITKESTPLMRPAVGPKLANDVPAGSDPLMTA